MRMSFALVGPAFDGVEEHAEDAEAVVTPASPLPGRLRRGEEAIGSSIPGPSCRRGWCRPRSPISRTPENRDFKSWFLSVSFSRALYFASSGASLISANLVNLFYNCSYFLRLKCIRYCFSSLKLLLRKLLLYYMLLLLRSYSCMWLLYYCCCCFFGHNCLLLLFNFKLL